jgi:hypothetical protein
MNSRIKFFGRRTNRRRIRDRQKRKNESEEKIKKEIKEPIHKT